MLVRKCDPATARELSEKDRQKLLAIVLLDGIEEPKLIQEALHFISKLTRKQRIS